MNKTFHFFRTPQIYFGTGKFNLLPSLIQQYKGSVLIITGGTSFIASPNWAILLNELKVLSITNYHEIIKTEPSPNIIDRICDKYRSKNIRVVVAIGGGSVLDAGKAISAMLLVHDSIKNYIESIGNPQKHDGRKIPFIAVPTTSGTGSEASKNAVISEIGDDGFKKSIRHDQFTPDIALIDPELSLSCPKDYTISCGMDAFTQLLESYLSPIASDMIVSLCLGAFRNINHYFIRVTENGNDIEARSGMAYAALISGIGLANAGLGIIHGFSTPIGAYFDIPHGVVCATLMAASNKITLEKLRNEEPLNIALKKYVEIGKIFSNEVGYSDDYYCDEFITLLYAWTEKLSIPKLSAYGITENDLDKIINATENKNNPIRLNKEEMRKILLERL